MNSSTVAGDIVDNDCDDLIDEETLNGIGKQVHSAVSFHSQLAVILFILLFFMISLARMLSMLSFFHSQLAIMFSML